MLHLSRTSRLCSAAGCFVFVLLAVTSWWIYSSSGPVQYYWGNGTSTYLSDGNARTTATVISSDGVGYYSWLPTIASDKDLCFREFIEESLAIQPAGSVFKLRTSDSCMLPQYTVGVALLWTPLGLAAFLANQVISPRPAANPWTSNLSGLAILVSGAAAGAIGLALLARFLAIFVRRRAALTIAAAVFIGIFALHYATFNAQFSHIYSFALVALLLVVTRRVESTIISEYFTPWANLLFAGVVLGFIGLVRPTNLIVGLVPLVVLAHCMHTEGYDTARRTKALFVFAASATTVVSIQLVLWYQASGLVFVQPYVDQGFALSRDTPKIVLDVLANPRTHGLFPWSPVAVVGIVGLILPSALRRYTATGLIVLVLQLGVVSTWTFPYGAAGLGARFFIDFSPIIAMGVANAVMVSSKRNRQLIFAFVAAATAVGASLTVAYWFRNIDLFGESWSGLANTIISPLP